MRCPVGIAIECHRVCISEEELKRWHELSVEDQEYILEKVHVCSLCKEVWLMVIPKVKAKTT